MDQIYSVVDHIRFSFIFFSSLQAVSKLEENWTELDVLVRPACYIVVQEAASPSRGQHNLGDKKRLVVHSNKADTGYSTTVEKILAVLKEMSQNIVKKPHEMGTN